MIRCLKCGVATLDYSGDIMLVTCKRCTQKINAQKAHGVYEKGANDLNDQENKIAMLQKELEFANNEANFWRLRAEQENALYVDLNFRYKIMTAPFEKKRAIQKEYLDYLNANAKKEQTQ